MPKRKMPKHIVLPNGMWRFVKSGSKTTKRRVSVMARRRYSRRSSSFGGGGLMSRGLIRPTGLISSALMGAGAATLAENTIGQPLGNLTGPAAGFAVGGIGGALGAYARTMLKGTVSVSTVGNY
jgi:hypothetical protein